MISLIADLQLRNRVVRACHGPCQGDASPAEATSKTGAIRFANQPRRRGDQGSWAGWEVPFRSTLLAFIVLLGGLLLGGPAAWAQSPNAEVASTEVETLPNTQSGFSRQDALIASVTIFVLAVFVGFEVITKVPPTLHTPLMSGSNAVSGITLVGALLAAGSGGLHGHLASWLGAAAVVMATVNVVGGFLVTHRMLAMFRRK